MAVSPALGYIAYIQRTVRRGLKGFLSGWVSFSTAICWVLRLIENALPFYRRPFVRPISGIPSWGLAAVDGTTAFALPADLLSAAAERRQRAPRGFAPGPRRTAKGLRPGVCNSNPPLCLSWAVWSTIVCAERFLVRPLRIGSGGGGNEGTLALHSHLTPSGHFRFFQLPTPGTT